MPNYLQERNTIIFDMDGTLVDSVGVWNQVDRELIRQLGGTPEDEMIVNHRRDLALVKYRTQESPYTCYCEDLGKICGSSLSGDEIMAMRHEIAHQMIQGKVKLKPGAAELVKKLKEMGKTLVIATTTNRGNMNIYRYKNQNILKELPLDEYFDAIYVREMVTAIKPDPQVHLKLMKELNKKPSDCFIFEDSLVGVRAGKAAGIPVAVIYDRYSEADQEEMRKLADQWYLTLKEALETIL